MSKSARHWAKVALECIERDGWEDNVVPALLAIALALTEPNPRRDALIREQTRALKAQRKLIKAATTEVTCPDDQDTEIPVEFCGDDCSHSDGYCAKADNDIETHPNDAPGCICGHVSSSHKGNYGQCGECGCPFKVQINDDPRDFDGNRTESVEESAERIAKEHVLYEHWREETGSVDTMYLSCRACGFKVDQPEDYPNGKKSRWSSEMQRLHAAEVALTKTQIRLHDIMRRMDEATHRDMARAFEEGLSAGFKAAYSKLPSDLRAETVLNTVKIMANPYTKKDQE